MSAPFDDHAHSYRQEVNASVAFSGRDIDHFAKRKAECLLAAISRQLGDTTELSVLDAGCGTGATDVHLVDHVANLIGVDEAAEAIAVAVGANPAVTYLVKDGLHLPLDDQAVDVAFAICVLHHVEPPDRPAFIAEMARVVRPGGLVSIFEHNPHNPLTRVAVDRCEFDEGVELLTQREVSSLLSRAGLELVERRHIVFTPVDGAVGQRIDAALRWLPLGAQHYVVARRPTEMSRAR